MTIRYRKLTSTGDYTFGFSVDNFYLDLQAVAQAIQTRLQLLKESWWRDLNDGLPLFQDILGTPASPENLAAIDGFIQQRIIDTPGVIALVSYESSFNKSTRQYSYTCVVQTQYSETEITGTI